MIQNTQYGYARTEQGTIIHISEINEHNRHHKYLCISCGQELIARMGKINIHHFAHKTKCKCSYETYLHNTAKQRFFDLYTDSLHTGTPFVLNYKVKLECTKHISLLGTPCYTEGLRPINLIERFKKIHMEKKVDNFIPDLYIEDESGNKIFIEIAVTHKCEPAKIQSGYRIIEFLIQSEDNFSQFDSRTISMNSQRVIAHNFKTPAVRGTATNCTEEFPFVIIYQSKKSTMIKATPDWIIQKTSKQYTVEKILRLQYKDAVASKIAAYNYDKRCKDCSICRYFRVSFFNDEWHCNLLKENVNTPSKAITCNKFRYKY